jgi:hypothetical protein
MRIGNIYECIDSLCFRLVIRVYIKLLKHCAGYFVGTNVGRINGRAQVFELSVTINKI